MFRISKDDMAYCIAIKKLDSNTDKRANGGRSIMPRAFTESGIYMLMTMLRGDLAIKQSHALIRMFRVIKEYMTGSQEA